MQFAHAYFELVSSTMSFASTPRNAWGFEPDTFGSRYGIRTLVDWSWLWFQIGTSLMKFASRSLWNSIILANSSSQSLVGSSSSSWAWSQKDFLIKANSDEVLQLIVGPTYSEKYLNIDKEHKSLLGSVTLLLTSDDRDLFAFPLSRQAPFSVLFPTTCLSPL